MPEQISFDIHLIGLKDRSRAGMGRVAAAIGRLRDGEPPSPETLPELLRGPLFEALSRERALEVTGVLEAAGALVEVRPVPGRPPLGDHRLRPTQKCPRCGFVQPAGEVECQQCGLVFAKWEREQVQRMQRERRLEEALTKALQVREEWAKKARQYVESHPLPGGAAAPFASRLHADEIPFAVLRTAQGSLLLTSRRLLARRDGSIVAIPWEMIADVDVGGGLTLRKDQTRLKLRLHGPVPLPDGTTDTVTFALLGRDRDRADLLMDWAFARTFVCGACGAADLDYHLDERDGTVRARCMHCATDHEIDLDEAVAIPHIVD